jgi:hypothetical protein
MIERRPCNPDSTQVLQPLAMQMLLRNFRQGDSSVAPCIPVHTANAAAPQAPLHDDKASQHAVDVRPCLSFCVHHRGLQAATVPHHYATRQQHLLLLLLLSACCEANPSPTCRWLSALLRRANRDSFQGDCLDKERQFCVILLRTKLPREVTIKLSANVDGDVVLSTAGRCLCGC